MAAGGVGRQIWPSWLSSVPVCLYDQAVIDAPYDIFTHALDFDPSTGEAGMEAFLQGVPGKWVVYLMADQDNRPIQLLCVKNLRASLKRRLGGEELVGPTRRVDYRDVVRRVYWRRVDSALEADWIYFEAARAIFPESYQDLAGLRPAWWVHVNPQTNYPRYVKSNDPTALTGGIHLGPIEEKQAAERYVQAVEGLFDLCRDYRLLTQAPHGGPCAWRQMNKCVGPCDGSISLSAYRQLIAHTVQVLSDIDSAIEAEEQRMQAAAGELRFEVAAKIKQFIEQLTALGKGPYRFVRPLERFVYVSLQPGPGAGKAKVLLLTPGRIEHVASLIGEPQPAASAALLATIRQRIAAAPEPLTVVGAQRLGLAARHLLAPRSAGGIFLHDPADARTLVRGYRDLMKQKAPRESEDEGVVKDLRAMA